MTFCFSLIFQGDKVPRPFYHIYGENGYFLTDEFVKNPTGYLISAVDQCQEYIETFHGKYLQRAGFENIDKYCDHLESHPNDINGLGVAMTVMLNHWGKGNTRYTFYEIYGL